MAGSRKSQYTPYDKETKTRRRLLEVHHHIGRVRAGSAYCKACKTFIKWDKASAFDPREWQAHMQTWEHGENARARTAEIKAEKRARSGKASTSATAHSDFELRTLYDWKDRAKENDEPFSEAVVSDSAPSGKDEEPLLEEKIPSRLRRKAGIF
ncbi:hypothetical protein BDZ89DRAFT_1032542 [Hymenopellis radicata]|nr:hypothetical protein BDZ89DRAFT_1032542 [Hymenopellis radicata]